MTEVMQRFCARHLDGYDGKVELNTLPLKADVVGAVLPIRGGSPVTLILNEKLITDQSYCDEVLDRIDACCQIEDMEAAGVTLAELVMLHMLCCVEHGHADPRGLDVFQDDFYFWESYAGRRMWLEAALEIDDMIVDSLVTAA